MTLGAAGGYLSVFLPPPFRRHLSPNTASEALPVQFGDADARHGELRVRKGAPCPGASYKRFRLLGKGRTLTSTVLMARTNPRLLNACNHTQIDRKRLEKPPTILLSRGVTVGLYRTPRNRERGTSPSWPTGRNRRAPRSCTGRPRRPLLDEWSVGALWIRKGGCLSFRSRRARTPPRPAIKSGECTKVTANELFSGRLTTSRCASDPSTAWDWGDGRLLPRRGMLRHRSCEI